jgi:hypothetical protein
MVSECMQKAFRRDGREESRLGLKSVLVVHSAWTQNRWNALRIDSEYNPHTQNAYRMLSMGAEASECMQPTQKPHTEQVHFQNRFRTHAQYSNLRQKRLRMQAARSEEHSDARNSLRMASELTCTTQNAKGSVLEGLRMHASTQNGQD